MVSSIRPIKAAVLGAPENAGSNGGSYGQGDPGVDAGNAPVGDVGWSLCPHFMVMLISWGQ